MATTTQARIDNFLKTAPGKKFNPDHAFGYQCKDLIDADGEALYDKPWYVVIRPGNGKDVYANAPTEYWNKTRNNPKDANQLPKRGDIVCYGARWNNPYGHVAIVLSADRKGIKVLQQDGFLQSAAHVKYLPFTWQAPIGWLSPKLPAVASKVYYTVKKGDTMSAIAVKYKTTLKKLASLNPNIKNLNVISIGQKIRVK